MSDYKNLIDLELERIEKAFTEYLDLRIANASKLGEVHVSHYGNIKEYLTRGGKRLRPLLATIGYKAIKKEVDVMHLYRAACSVELLHNGSLLHDDLIDRDETRRGGPTVHALYRDWYMKKKLGNRDRAEQFGMAMAILGGDMLLNMGAEIISDSELDDKITVECLKYYQEAYRDLADGVLLEMYMVKDTSIATETYLDMIRMKTAVLFEKSLLLGATIARASDSQKRALSEFSVKVGQAFQIQDDILGSFGDVDVTGKPADGDIREGKNTILVIESFRKATDDQERKLIELLGKTDMTEEQVQVVKDIFETTGALERSRDLMKHLLEEGQSALNKADPPLESTYKGLLIYLSNFLVNRNY